jgi:hypothetical protein
MLQVVLDAVQAHENPQQMRALIPCLFKVLASVNDSRSASSLAAQPHDESFTQVYIRVRAERERVERAALRRHSQPSHTTSRSRKYI